MTRTPRVALVGCGAVAEFFHLPPLLEAVGPGGVWLVDPDLERARALARPFGGEDRVAAGHAEIAGEVDAAIVAAPNHLHASVAGELLERGVAVLVEKPLARTAAEARPLVRPDGQPVCAVAHFRRFFPSVRLVRELLADGICGAPRRIDVEEGYVHAWGSVSDFWLDRERSGGGVLLDLGSHVLDLLRYWLREELRVGRYRDDAVGGVEADCAAELTSVHGVEVRVELSRTRLLRGTAVFECERGTIEAPLASAATVVVRRAGRETLELEAGGERQRARDGYPAAFAAQLDDFLGALGGRRAPAVPVAEGLAVLELVDACYARRERLPEPWVEGAPAGAAT